MTKRTISLTPGVRALWIGSLLWVGVFSAGAQARTDFTSVLAKRAGSAEGAKPCRYEDVLHPCVLVTPQRLALVRREVIGGLNGRKAVYDRYIKPVAEMWLNRSIRIPPTGGWPHDYFCVDGTMLVLPADERFNPADSSVCPLCGRKYLSPKIRAARHSFEHYWLCQAVRDLALVYAIGGDKAYAAKGIEILTKYADAYPRENLQDLTLLEAVNLIPLAEGYDLLYNQMTPKQRAHIARDFFWPAAQALTKAGFGGNWGSWHLAAIGVIGYATKHQRFIDFATHQFKAQITDQLGKDGLWPESVSTYHFYPLDGFLAFVEAAANNGDTLYRWEAAHQKGIEAMFRAPLRYAYPNMRLAAINDGWYDAYLPEDQYTMAYYLYGLGEFGWAVQQIRKGGHSGVPGDFLDQHYRDLLYGASLAKKFSRPEFKSIDFPVLGIAVLRQGSSAPRDREMMMTFDYGPLLGHGQPDKMGVTLFGEGKLRVADYGTTGYGSEVDRFLRSTPAHNTIVVDGVNQPKTGDRNLIAFKDVPSLKLASARTAEVAQGATWTRTVMLTDHYGVVWDHLIGTQSHQYDWFFHADGHKLSVTGAGPAAEDSVTGTSFSYPFLQDVSLRPLKAKTGTALWDEADGGVRLWFMNAAPNQRVYSATMPTGGRERAPLVVLRLKAADADFVSVIQPFKTGRTSATPTVQFDRDEAGAIRVRIRIMGRLDKFYLTGKRVLYEKQGAVPVVAELP